MVLKRVALGYSTDSDQQYMFLRLCFNWRIADSGTTTLKIRTQVLESYTSNGTKYRQISAINWSFLSPFPVTELGGYMLKVLVMKATHTHTNRQTKHPHTQTQTKHKHTHRQTHTQTDTQTKHTHTEKDTHTHTDTQTETHTHRHTHTHTPLHTISSMISVYP